jgi:hypothetical protein
MNEYSYKCVPVKVFKAHRGGKLELDSFLPPRLDGNKWWGSCLRRCTPERKHPVPYRVIDGRYCTFWISVAVCLLENRTPS